MKKTAKPQEKSYRYARDMIYLVSCAVNEKTPDAKFVRDMDLERIYRTASRHMLASAASFALESAGVKDPHFEEARWRAIRRVALMDAEMEDLLDRFFVPVSKRSKQYNAYAGTYPLFYKYKVLLPLLPFYRTFRAMGNGRFRSEAQAIRDAGKR